MLRPCWSAEKGIGCRSTVTLKRKTSGGLYLGSCPVCRRSWAIVTHVPRGGNTDE